MAKPKNIAPVRNSDPLGRKHDNVHPSYFGPQARRSRGVSLSGLRPSFFAMLRGEKSPPKKGE